jgi:MOSC domain-containing protein YiiM
MPMLIGIYTTHKAGERMLFRPQVEAIAGLGLEGDRYALQLGSWKAKGETTHKKKRNVTLIGIEDIRNSNVHLSPENKYTAAETRRCLITQDADLRKLIGRQFSIGDVVFFGVEPSIPCDRPDKLSGKTGFEKAFQGRGGINAEILQGGMLRIRFPIIPR